MMKKDSTRKIYLPVNRTKLLDLSKDIIFYILDILEHNSQVRIFYSITIKALLLVNKKMCKLVFDYLKKKCIIFQLYDNPLTKKIIKKTILNSNFGNMEFAYLLISILRLIDKNNVLRLSGKFKIFGEFVNELFRKKKYLSTVTLEETVLKILSDNIHTESKWLKIFIDDKKILILTLVNYIEKQLHIYSLVVNVEFKFYPKDSRKNKYVFSIGDPNILGVGRIFYINFYFSQENSYFISDSLFTSIYLDTEENWNNEFGKEYIMQAIENKIIEFNFSINKIEKNRIKEIIKKILKKISKGWSILEENYSRIVQKSGIKIDNNNLRYTSGNMDIIYCYTCNQSLSRHPFYYTKAGFPRDKIYHLLCYCISKLIKPSDGYFFDRIRESHL